MIRLDSRHRVLAIALAALAGAIDATGFMMTGGFFVSFMSGNSTRLGVGLSDTPSVALTAAGLIASFLLGVIAGSLIGRGLQSRARSIVALVALLIASAGIAATYEMPSLCVVLLAVAMGVENAVFEHSGVNFGLTYMTGAIVKFGQFITARLSGERPLGGHYHLLLWLGLVTGAMAGAIAFTRMGPAALFTIAAYAALLAILARNTAALASGDASGG